MIWQRDVYKRQTFEDVLSDVKSQFTKELTKERVGMRMNDWVRLEKNFFLRIVPLELKTLFLQIGANFGGKSITAVFSNIGVIRIDVYKRQLYISRWKKL